jgi:hypothetical protein
VSAGGRAAEMGAVALVLVSVSFFVFMMVKVPLYGAYKLSAKTFGVFKLAWWIIFGLLSMLSFADYTTKEKPLSKSKTTGNRRDRLRPRANS